MKKTVILFTLILFIFSCGEKVREEILKRHANGQMKLLVKYKGKGGDEVITERITYNVNGDILLLEKPMDKFKMVRRYYENGQKRREKISKDGKLDGKWTLWYENGQKKWEKTYKDGELDGLWTEWHENGQKSIEGNYKEGEHTGRWTSWDSLGVETSALGWYLKGNRSAENKEYDKAISFYLRAIELKPDDAFTYYNMGYTYDKQSNDTKAIESYEKVIELKPDSTIVSAAYSSMGVVYHDNGDFKTAIIYYKKSARLGHKGAQDYLRKNGYDW